MTDQRGAFAMGTSEGIRSRKYHGFFLGIPGRSETSFVSDLEIVCNGIGLWPHLYRGPENWVRHPDPESSEIPFSCDLTYRGPRWKWGLREGKLFFGISARRPGGIRLSWRWASAAGKKAKLTIRPLCAMRDLHALGGKPWGIEISANSGAARGRIFTPGEAMRAQGERLSELQFWAGALEWNEEPAWYENFVYPEEKERGYPDEENIYSLGYFSAELGSGQSCDLVFAEDPNDLPSDLYEESGPLPSLDRDAAARPAELDFVLTRPAGVVAGFPWFGEWGRDTFISLPGIVVRWLTTYSADPSEVWNWTEELLFRWGEWIRSRGMLPNVLEKEGESQWHSADATLWWCHALASLWCFSLASAVRPEFAALGRVESAFSDLLGTALASIREGRHAFLKVNAEGLLEVTAPFVSWMDARVDGRPVTPRTGLLPEFNALWFEALCLEWLWSKKEKAPAGLEDLGRLTLARCIEPGRPNRIFLHSLPFSPSFVLGETETLRRDLEEIRATLWTPVGLRTLSPGRPGYSARCEGDQRTRDLAYHQGLPWPWLGGHYEMARFRLEAKSKEHFPPAMLTAEALASVPIPGHIPEIFDAEAPFAARGAPAQAWSEACLEEAGARRRARVDRKVTRLLAERWTERAERKEQRERQGSAKTLPPEISS